VTSANRLAEACRRLVAALAEHEERTPDRVSGIRTRLVAHIDEIMASLAAPRTRCERHPDAWSDTCSACRSERIGRSPYDPLDPRRLPATPEHVTHAEARRLGESNLESQ
jgi:hypothetical protein